MLQTTLAKPRRFEADTIVGYNIRDLLNPSDQQNCLNTFKKVILENAYDFITYSIHHTLSFISLLVPHDGNVACFELASSPLTNKEYQKNMLLDAASNLIPDSNIHRKLEPIT